MKGLSRAVTAALLALLNQAIAVSPAPDELTESRTWTAAHLDTFQPTNVPFSFNYDGKPSAQFFKSKQPILQTQKLDDYRARRTLVWNDPQTGLEVRCVAVEYLDFPTIEWTLYFKNTDTNDAPTLSDIEALDTRFAGPAAGEYILHHLTGDNCSPSSYEPHELRLAPGADHRFAPAGGRPTSVGFPFFALAWPGGGVIAAIGWPGQWAAQFTRGKTGVRIRGGQDLTHIRLHPGEEIRTPLVVLQFWSGDRIRAQNLWRRWMYAHNLPRNQTGELPPPLLTSCGGGFFPGIQCTEATERQFITAFKEAGVKLDYWWLDAGWYPCDGNWPKVGTWEPDPGRFPRGLKAVSDQAHTNGLGFIVWFEPERVTPGTWLYTNNPAWLLGRDGEQKLLNLGNKAARHWLTEHVDTMLTREGIDLYRQDFNIDPLPYWRANDAPDRQGITEIRHVEGYLAYWDELRRRHPNLLIDSCASGGRRNDLETLRRAVPLLRSDYQAFDGNPAYAPGNQCHTYGLSSWIPYHGQGVYFSARHFVYSARSYLSPALGIAVDVRKPDIDWPLVRRVADQWRKVAPCYRGDFYPLTPYHLGDEVWMAWQFDLPETGEGMLQVFRRAASPYEIANLKLKGLVPEARYRVTDFDAATPKVISGQQLIQDGLRISLPDRPSSALVTYQKIQ